MKNTVKASEATILRQKAEDLLKKRPFKSTSDLSEVEVEILKLIHELEVHHIELEMQNEELMLAKEKAEMAAEKYTELYDFAPIGYFTLSAEGAIIELNFSGAKMMEKERSRLIKSQFGFFISDAAKPVYNSFLENIFNGKNRETCEVSLTINGNSPKMVLLTGIATENSKQCFITVVDITNRKQTE